MVSEHAGNSKTPVGERTGHERAEYDAGGEFKRKTDAAYENKDVEQEIVYERKHVKEIVHVLTSEIKTRGTKVPLLVLPFRSEEIDDGEALGKLVGALTHGGRPRGIVDIEKAVKETESVYLLMSALKYFWCRLPGNAIIGWKAYTKFVKLEEESGFSKRSFLEFMPNCLSSGAHASIVYDLFDLIVAIVINSKKNLMTTRKLCRMMGLWAFNPIRNAPTGEPSFERGLLEWIPSSDAMFHLLLSFLRSMPPGGDIGKLPSAFQVLLKSNEYPPVSTSSQMENSKTLMEVPKVTLKVSRPSKNPAELISKVAKTLKFDDAGVFKTREDYLLLKRLFKDADGEVVKKLTAEGERILENLCLTENGWSKSMTTAAASTAATSADDFLSVDINRVSIDDYFIWTWLGSLGNEETELKKKTFGKSYIMEVELAEGFKKWVILEEQDVERDGYDIELELKQEKLKELKAQIHMAEKKLNDPPPPLPKDYGSPEGIPERSKKRPVSTVLQDDTLTRDIIRLQQDYAQGLRIKLKDGIDDDEFLRDTFLEGEDLEKLGISQSSEREDREREKREKREKMEREVREKLERERIDKEIKERVAMEARVREEVQLRESQEREARLRARDMEIQKVKEMDLIRKQKQQQRERQQRERAEFERQQRERVEFERQQRERMERERLAKKAMQEQRSRDVARAREVNDQQRVEARERELQERERALAIREQQMQMQAQQQQQQQQQVQQVQAQQRQRTPSPQHQAVRTPVQRYTPPNNGPSYASSSVYSSQPSLGSVVPPLSPPSGNGYYQGMPPMGMRPPMGQGPHSPHVGSHSPHIGSPHIGSHPYNGPMGPSSPMGVPPSGYTSAIISQMPKQTKVNKKAAREAFMGNGFGI